ncbi:serine hydrolase domain-containing protein [Leucobacter sp. W1153]|uniref:serine hydrolase domain-containing protein n=1 Tax=Leucobacter sp. W1153 TaxID=3439064 RepID=UPI003F3BE14E
MPTEVIGGSVVSKLERRARIAALSLLTVAALGLTACTSNGSASSEAEVSTVDAGLASLIDEAVNSAMQQSGSTGAIVGVWTGSAGDYVQAYGEAPSANAPIRGAQATQPVMCALLLELVADGVVTLDREVSADVSRQVGIEGITYGQLCTAQSGLADYKGRIGDIFVNNPTRPWSDRELLSYGLAHSPLSWPGLDVHPSDTDALLLGRALRQVTGTSIPELLETHVFGKANMPSSYYPGDVLSSGELPSGGLTGLTYPAAGGVPQCEVGPIEVTEVSPSMLGTAGATVTTVTDLKNFYASYLGGQLGGSESAGVITEVRSTTNPIRNEAGEPVGEGEEAAALIAAAEDPNGQKWGFGYEKVQSLSGMSGQMTGTLTASYHDPATGFSVVAVLNNSSIGASFVRTLAFELAALSAEAGVGPAVTWSSADFAAARAGAAICQPAPEEAAPVE